MLLKTNEEIAIIKKGAHILSQLHKELLPHIQPGITTAQLDKIAETYIKDHHATPSFKGYQGYPATLCTSINEEVIHGIPSNYQLKDGDIISIDCGVYYQGYHSDAATTHPVGNVTKELLNLLSQTKAALYHGIEQATTQNTLGDIGHAIQQHITQHNYHIIEEYGGHGIGQELHEEPHIPNYGEKRQGKKLKNGMVIAIEPLVSLGNGRITQATDGWTVLTQDKKSAAHFEHTIAIINDQPQLLTSHL